MRIPEEFTWRLAGRGAEFDHGGGECVHGSLSVAARAPRVAMVAHFDPGSRFSRSMRALAGALAAQGYVVVVVSSSPEIPDTDALPSSTVVIMRPNLGYDFGSWATALHLLPEVRECAEVILTNDSMVGPFAPLGPLLERAGGAEVWAVTSSLQLAPHLQSYFLRFGPGVLAHPELQIFFDGVRHLTNKVAIVRRYELGLTRAIQEAGMRSSAGFPAGTLGVGTANPTTAAWRALMEAGYPFFKRTLLYDSRVLVGHDVLRDAVRDLFGVDLDRFLEEPA